MHSGYIELVPTAIIRSMWVDIFKSPAMVTPSIFNEVTLSIASPRGCG